MLMKQLVDEDMKAIERENTAYNRKNTMSNGSGKRLLISFAGFI